VTTGSNTNIGIPDGPSVNLGEWYETSYDEAENQSQSESHTDSQPPIPVPVPQEEEKPEGEKEEEIPTPSLPLPPPPTSFPHSVDLPTPVPVPGVGTPVATDGPEVTEEHGELEEEDEEIGQCPAPGSEEDDGAPAELEVVHEPQDLVEEIKEVEEPEKMCSCA
jgi:hypothetical protein